MDSSNPREDGMNWALLDGFCANDGDRSFLVELVALFELDIPRRMAALDAARAARDIAATTERAHSIKGSCGTVGAEAMAACAEAVELAASRNDLRTVDQRAAELRVHFERAVEALRARLR